MNAAVMTFEMFEYRERFILIQYISPDGIQNYFCIDMDTFYGYEISLGRVD